MLWIEAVRRQRRQQRQRRRWWRRRPTIQFKNDMKHYNTTVYCKSKRCSRASFAYMCVSTMFMWRERRKKKTKQSNILLTRVRRSVAHIEADAAVGGEYARSSGFGVTSPLCRCMLTYIHLPVTYKAINTTWLSVLACVLNLNSAGPWRGNGWDGEITFATEGYAFATLCVKETNCVLCPTVPDFKQCYRIW